MVDRDGRLVRARVRIIGAATGSAPAPDALRRLLLELQLDTLPAVLTVRTANGFIAPPPMRVEVSAPPAPARVAAWMTLGAAASAAATSLAFGLTAASQLGTLPPDGRFTTEAQALLQVQGNRFATLSLGTGLGAGALLATSLALFSASGPVTVAAAPSSSGGEVIVRGRF